MTTTYGRALRYLALAFLLVLGAAVGLAGSFLQAWAVPGGLLIALAGTAGVFFGGGILLGTRAGAVLPAAGWLIVVMGLTASRGEGDFVFASQAGSYGYLLVGTLLAAVAVTVPFLRVPRAS